MFPKRKCILAALAMLTLCANAANAGVTINGKGLKDINDIVVETTGSRILRREAVLKVMKASDGKFRFYTIKGDGDGNSVNLSQAGQFNLNNINGGKTNTGAWPAVGTKRTSDGAIVLLVPGATDSGVTATLFSIGIDANSKVNNCSQIQSVSVASGSNLYVNDAAGGLFPNGKDGEEVFAVAYFSADGNKIPGNGQGYTSYLALVDAKGNVKTHRIGSMSGCFPSVRVAVGDFDRDGNTELTIFRDGREWNYYMQVFDVDSSLDIAEIYNTSLGARDDGGADNIDGCDIVAGDFDGDGYTDIAAIYADKKGDDGRPAVTTFKWNANNSGFDTKYNYDGSDDVMMGSTNWTRSSYVPHFGIVADAGDLDADGRDELVFLTADYGVGGLGAGGDVIISVWGMDNSLSPSRKFLKNAGYNIFGYGGVWPVNEMAECSYLPRSVTLALVPVGDKLDTGGVIRRVFASRCQGDDKEQRATNYKAGDSVYYYTPTLSNGSITGLSDKTEYMPGSAGRAMGLVAGDVYCETVELGDPTHMVYEAERSYIAEIQTPPYHVDYVQVPFAIGENIPTKPTVLNMTYMGSNVTYSKSDTESEKTDVSFKTTDIMDWGVDASASAKIKLVGVSASGGYKQTATNVENKTSSSEAKTTLTITDSTDAADNVVLYKSDRHVWRYPVISEIPNKPSVEGVTLNGECFMTFSLCDTPTTSHGAVGQSSEFDDYNPSHEEGNLFSYPTKIEDIPYYSKMQREFTKEQGKTVGDGSKTTIELSVSDSGTNTDSTTTTSKKAVNGSTSVSIPIPKVMDIGVSATAAYSSELTNTETFTKSYSTTEKFTVTLNSGTLGFDSGKIEHLIKTQLYSDVAGVMKVGFAVDLKSTPGDTAEVWEDNGMYGVSPDIALVLPSRFTRYKSVINNVTRDVWTANDNRKSAIQLRGIWFWDGKKEDGKLATSTLVRGKTYTIEIPVYNASFKAPDKDVEIEMQLRVLDKEKAASDDIILKDIAHKTFKIEGWKKDTEDNKKTVEFEWKVPSDLAAGNYALYFILDPKDEIKELHEDWDLEKDPGGNNVGCYPIGILEKEPEAYITASTEVSTAASESDFEMVFQHPGMKDGEWISLEQFRTELADEPKDFRAYAKVSYNGSDTLSNMYLDVIRLDSDGTESRIATRIIPVLHPGTTRESSFMVSPEKVKQGVFSASLSGSGVNLYWGKKSDSGSGSGGSGSGGGCDAGFGGLALLGLATLAALGLGKRL